MLQTPSPFTGRENGPHAPLNMFVATAAGSLESSVVAPGDPLTWHHTGHMGVVFRIEAAAPFSLECGHRPDQIVGLASCNSSGTYDIFVPTGIPIATAILNPLTVRFRTVFLPDPDDPEHRPVLAVTDPLAVTVYGHRWEVPPAELPMVPDCVVPVGRNFVRVNRVAVCPLYPTSLATLRGY
jgi:hypothetical protein